MPSLIVSTWDLPAAKPLAEAARRRGWIAQSWKEAQSNRLPRPLVLYSGTDLADTISQWLHLALVEPAWDLLSKVPFEFRLRPVEMTTAGALRSRRGQSFIKPADPRRRIFDAGVYRGIDDIDMRRPLQPSSNLYLVDFSLGEVGPRLSEQFKLAWLRLPFAVRRILVQHWRLSPPIPHLCGSPYIECLDSWARRGRNDFASYSAAHVFRFWSLTVELPDEILQSVIAHECTHTYLQAIGENDPDYHSKSRRDNSCGEEMDVDNYIDFWGYRPYEFFKYVKGTEFKRKRAAWNRRQRR